MVSLPQFFRSPEQSPLRMNCINHVLQKVKKYAYSHHIERLMIIGNFTLLCEINPQDVNKRFREMYADAFERVVTPNVLGMSQYADG
jgi:deoxyribodipyrimidine photolyase-related protein